MPCSCVVAGTLRRYCDAMPRGRPPQFNDDDVLDAAAALFKRDGFDAVGVAEVCRCAGLPVQSLYNRFGDKAGLYRAVLDRYGRTANDPQIDALQQEDDALQALQAFVAGWRRHRTAGVDDGCLFTQTLARGHRGGDGPDATARAYTARLRKALAATVRRAVAAGQLHAKTNAATLADGLLTLAFGVAVIGRGGMPASMIDNSIATGHELILAAVSGPPKS